MPKYIKINYDSQDIRDNMLIINYAIKLILFCLFLGSFALNN